MPFQHNIPIIAGDDIDSTRPIQYQIVVKFDFYYKIIGNVYFPPFEPVGYYSIKAIN